MFIKFQIFFIPWSWSFLKKLHMTERSEHSFDFYLTIYNIFLGDSWSWKKLLILVRDVFISFACIAPV